MICCDLQLGSNLVLPLMERTLFSPPIPLGQWDPSHLGVWCALARSRSLLPFLDLSLLPSPCGVTVLEWEGEVWCYWCWWPWRGDDAGGGCR